MYKTSTTIVSIERSSNITTSYRYIKIFILKCIQKFLMGGIYTKIYIWEWTVLE